MKEKITYVARDGREFLSKDECLHYENGDAFRSARKSKQIAYNAVCSELHAIKQRGSWQKTLNQRNKKLNTWINLPRSHQVLEEMLCIIREVLSYTDSVNAHNNRIKELREKRNKLKADIIGLDKKIAEIDTTKETNND